MPYDETMAGLLDDALAGLDGVFRRKMFGGLGYFTEGQMFACIWHSEVALKLSEEDLEEVLKLPGASLFDPMAGRPMKQLAVLPADILDDAAALRDWAERSHRFVRTTPPK